MMAPISSNLNCINISGSLEISDSHRVLAAMHDRIDVKKYSDIVLDFSRCTTAFPGPMAAIASQAINLRQKEVSVGLILPKDEKLERLFVNADWAHLMCPDLHGPSKFRGTSQVPAIQFTSAVEQSGAVNTVMDKLLESLTGFSRENLAAIEWSLNEISDNVIVHSQSPVGGLVQMSTQRRRQMVELVICDPGIGIPSSLRPARSDLQSDSEALYYAIQEGVTSGAGQGNGLFGSFQICRISGGYFDVHSGFARLSYNEKTGLRTRREQVPFRGTLVIAGIDYSTTNVLSEALRFGGKVHQPTDYIETKYEAAGVDEIRFDLAIEASSIGSRVAGAPVRTKLQNLLSLTSCRITIDCDNVALISSSFADEVFAKLFAQMGPMQFMNRIVIANATPTVQNLIDRAIAQRMSLP
jgi:hypothetical protein